MPRLDQLLARNTGHSRRELAKAFRRGHIRERDGTPIRDAGRSIAPQACPVTVRFGDHEVALYHRLDVLLHKPVGVVTARRDDRHQTAFSLVHHHPLADELRSVGRLDLDCSGLLLWTNEGAHVHALTHPRRLVPRTYHVALVRPWRTDQPHVTIDDHDVALQCISALERPRAHPALQIPDTAARLATITLTTGKFHEVKRIFAALGSEVLALARISHGPWQLPKALPAGESMLIDLDAPPPYPYPPPHPHPYP